MARSSTRVLYAIAAALILAAPMLLSTSARAVTYGTSDSAHSYVGAIVAQFPDGTFGWCSGALIAPRVFLTAGHCTLFFTFFGATVSTIWVTFNAKIFPSGFPIPATVYAPGPAPSFPIPAPGWLPIVAFVADPQFTGYLCRQGCPTLDSHDLAVAILPSPVTTVGLAVLPPLGFLDNLQGGTLVQASVAKLGYGLNQTFQVQAQREISHAPFLGIAPHWLYTQQTNASGSGGTCVGDSGGPQLLTVAGTEYLVATNVLVVQTCTFGVDAGYRMDTGSAQTFLLAEIAANP